MRKIAISAAVALLLGVAKAQDFTQDEWDTMTDYQKCYVQCFAQDYVCYEVASQNQVEEATATEYCTDVLDLCALTCDSMFQEESAEAVTLQSLSSDNTFSVTVNKDHLRQMGEHVARFGAKFAQHTQVEAQQVVKALADAHKNTEAKIIMNFGKTVAPLLENYGELTKAVKVGKECDQDCAVQCYIGNGYGLAGFSEECFSSCGCVFKFQEWTQKEQEKAMKKVQKI